ncbi:MAG: hypothetical protein AAF230_06535 [Pseudomonadota bacterium]
MTRAKQTFKTRFIAQHLAETLVDALCQPYLANGRNCRIGASIGLVFEAGAHATPTRLTRFAELPCNTPKRPGAAGA